MRLNPKHKVQLVYCAREASGNIFFNGTAKVFDMNDGGPLKSSGHTPKGPLESKILIVLLAF